jgi:hypothetical protein
VNPASPQEADGDDPLARFRSWRGFLVAAIAVNALFVFTMLGHNAPGVAVWHKVLIWLPFNAIATAVYLAILSRLSWRGEGQAPTLAGRFYAVLCTALIIANWAVMFVL